MSLVLNGSTGITYPDGKVQLGAAALEQVGMITHTSDTALATVAAGGNQMGSAVSMVIPAAGVVRVTLVEIEVDETEGNNARWGIALKVGSGSLLWSVTDVADSSAQYWYVQTNASVASMIISNGFRAEGVPIVTNTWDIVGQSLATGTQDVEVWLGDNIVGHSGEITVTASTKTARFLVEVVDGT